jgi:ABC-type uncharacterized transport system involved in gliding motility auxiliary subunit
MRWVRNESFFGQRFAQAIANNGDLVLNAVDNLTGNSDLISIRGRASFVRLRARRGVAAAGGGSAARNELEEELRRAEGLAIETLRPVVDNPDTEQEQELGRFQDEKLRIRKELREVRHGLDQEIERLGTLLKVISIALVPLLLTIARWRTVWRRRRAASRVGFTVGVVSASWSSSRCSLSPARSGSAASADWSATKPPASAYSPRCPRRSTMSSRFAW